MKLENEVIKHAAVKSVDGWIFLGKCHADCFHQAHNIGVKMSQSADDQGFVTSHGRYLRRRPAAILAGDAGQVDRKIAILFSEDLWHKEHGGQFQYDPIEGYFK